MPDAHHAHEGESVQRFLAWASREMTSSLDYETRLGRIAWLAVPTLGDCCIVDVLEGSVPRRLPVAYADPAHRDLARALQEGTLPGVESFLGIAQACRDEKTTRHVATAAAPHALRARSAVASPLACGGRILGALAVVSVGQRRDVAADLTAVEDFAQRAASAIDNSRVHQEAREAVQTRDRLLRVVSHDLRNELAITVSSYRYLEHIGAFDERADEARALRRIGRACANMQHLVADLLDMAAIRAGRLGLHRKPVALDQVIAGVVEAYEPVALEADVALRSSIGSDMKACGDARRLRQAVGNVMTNAIKHSPRGATITVGLAREGDCALVSVRDQGPGIPPHEAAQLFDEFASFDRESKAGTGLGLFIARSIIERHGGHIRLESAVGRGSTFILSLPLSTAEPGSPAHAK